VIKAYINQWVIKTRTCSLTASNDVFELTDGNDLVEGEVGTLANTDIIIDGSTTDNDTMNVTIDEDDLAPTVDNVENINLELDVFNGADATFDASNVSGATTTLDSAKLGYDGEAEVSGAGTNNVTAGSNVDTLTITGLTTGTVNTGGADTVSVTGSATRTSNVTINGDIDLTMATSTELALTATADAEVDLTPGLTPGALTEIDVAGANDVTINMGADDFDALVLTDSTENATVIANMNAAASGLVDASDVEADVIELSADIGNTITVASGAVVDITADSWYRYCFRWW